MRQQNITLPVIGGAGGYVIPDFKKGLGEFAEGVLSVDDALVLTRRLVREGVLVAPD